MLYKYVVKHIFQLWTFCCFTLLSFHFDISTFTMQQLMMMRLCSFDWKHSRIINIISAYY